jgi:serine O-acetyltransferase
VAIGLVHPRALWALSTRLYQRGHRRLARLIKAINYLLFKAILPPEAQLGGWVALGHFGLGVVIHPNVSIGAGTHIHHGVTLASDSPPGGLDIVIEDDVTIGAGAVIINSRPGTVLTVGRGAVIGANAVVAKDVPPWAVVAGNPARILRTRDDVGTRGRYTRKP